MHPTSIVGQDKPLLYDLTLAVAEAKSLDDIYRAALDCLCQTLGTERSSILLADAEGVMRFAAWRNLSEEYRAVVDGHSPWNGESTNAQPIAVDDVRSDGSLRRLLPALDREAIRALAFIPLTSAGRLLGKFMVYYGERHEFSEREIAVARAIAAQVAFAIEHHVAIHERQRSAQLMAGEKRTLQLLLSDAPMKEVLTSIARVVEDLGPMGTSASVLLLDGAGSLKDATSSNTAERPVTNLSAGEIASLAAKGHAGGLWMGGEAGARSSAEWCQPILSRDGQLLGILATSLGEKRMPTPADRQMLEMLAETAAVAIERAREYAERQRERDNLNAMFRATAAGIARTDTAGRFTEMNDRFCELAGRSRQELLGGMDFADLAHEDDRRRFRGCLASIREGAGHAAIEGRLTGPGARETWVSMVMSGLRDEGGPLSGAVAVITDVTERKVTEEMAQGSEARYQTLVEAVGLAVYTTDATGRITLFNEAAVDVWGRRPTIGKDMWYGSWKLFWPDGTAMAHEDSPMDIALRENRPVRGMEVMVQRPDGSMMNILPHPTPLLDGGGNVAGAVNVLVDITGQKKMQEALQEALQAKDDFLGLVSHELRTPLTTLKGMANVLRRHGDALSQQERDSALLDIERGADQLQRIVENMLTLARAESGPVEDIEPQLLRRLMDSVISEQLEQFPERRVARELPEELLPVLANAGYVRQIVGNLLSNARKYSPPTSPIEVRLARDGNAALVTVSDRGIGIAPEQADRLFDAFFRSKEVSVRAPGIGLGLTVCKRLVELQGGEIWAKARQGGGATFGFTLPLALEPTA